MHKIIWKTRIFVKMFLVKWRYFKMSQFYFYKRTKWHWIKESIKYGWSWTKAYDDVFKKQVCVDLWRDRMNREFWVNVYQILVKECGVNPDNQMQFLYNMLRGAVEYRFCGDLGFGGKIWNNAGRVYINYYLEDTTKERELIVERVNKRIANLMEGQNERARSN